MMQETRFAPSWCQVFKRACERPRKASSLTKFLRVVMILSSPSDGAVHQDGAKGNLASFSILPPSWGASLDGQMHTKTAQSGFPASFSVA
jgi:hypothetical protein